MRQQQVETAWGAEHLALWGASVPRYKMADRAAHLLHWPGLNQLCKGFKGTSFECCGIFVYCVKIYYCDWFNKES